MYTSEEMLDLTNLKREMILLARCTPFIKNINECIIEKANQGFYKVTHIDCDFLRASNTSKEFTKTGISEEDYMDYIARYYKDLGYKVKYDYYSNTLAILWEEK